jgi:uncharacterized protein YndB with AHSA1/START domain
MTETGVLSLTTRRRFAAPRKRVFEAWTDAAQIKEWFGRSEGIDIPSVDADVRVGGNYRIQFESSEGSAAIVGTYREVAPAERLVFTFAWDPPVWDVMKGDQMLVTVDFLDAEGGTEVVLNHERLGDSEAVAFHSDGWDYSLLRLERFLADNERS